jgi:putative hemolysin
MAQSTADLRAAQSLRFLVFNVELGEGLEQSYHTCRDEDAYDEVCDHLLVECEGEVIGTYRLQAGVSALANRGYYSEQEFDFSPFEASRGEIVELGRACVAREHRNVIVLGLLWRGISAYARARQCRYLIGCSSLNSQDEAEGAALYHALALKHRAPFPWRTLPHAPYACCEPAAALAPRAPKLLSAYLALGATICAPPAIDREFKTIDFLTLLDLETVAPGARRYLADATCVA